MTANRISFFVVFTLILAMATAASARDTTLIRHESTFLRDSKFQLNAEWLVYTHGHLQAQAYTLWESSTGKWIEVNAAGGPVYDTPVGKLSVPVGLRLHPWEGWRSSHAITKANLFGRAGDWPYFLVNDLSWALGGRGANEHFIQQQLAYQPKDSRVGLGIQAEQVLAGSQAVSTKVGPVLKLTYAKSDNWAWTVDILPFYDTTQKGTGLKLNLLTFHFGR